VKRAHRHPDGRGDGKPGGDAQHEREPARPKIAKRAGTPDQTPRRLGDALGCKSEHPSERTQQEDQRAFAVDAHDDDAGDECRHHDREQRARGREPCHLGRERHGREHDEQEHERVEQALGDHRRSRLSRRGTGVPVQHDDAHDVARAEGKDAVEELAHEKCARRRWCPRPR